MTRTDRSRHLVPGDSTDWAQPFRVRQEFTSADGEQVVIQDWWPSGYERAACPWTTANKIVHVPSGWSHSWWSNTPPWPDDIGARIAMAVWPVAAKIGGFRG